MRILLRVRRRQADVLKHLTHQILPGALVLSVALLVSDSPDPAVPSLVASPSPAVVEASAAVEADSSVESPAGSLHPTKARHKIAKVPRETLEPRSTRAP